MNLYTCRGKGGIYELLGTAKGAGASQQAETQAVYRDTATGALYFRTLDDFTNRMEQMPTRPIERRKPLAHAILPVDVQTALEQAALALSMSAQAHERLVEVIRQHLPHSQVGADLTVTAVTTPTSSQVHPHMALPSTPHPQQK